MSDTDPGSGMPRSTQQTTIGGREISGSNGKSIFIAVGDGYTGELVK